jgi:hypothetical protein
MSRKSDPHIEGQSRLFDPETGAINNGEPEETSPSVVYGPEGSYVDIATRAQLLGSSLLALGRRNQRIGFDLASHTKPYSSPIWGKYEEFTPIVIEGAQRNVENFLDVAKRDFWAATGYTALRSLKNDELRGLGLTDENIDARGRKMWREFTRRYGDPQVRPQRDKYKERLKRAIKSQRTSQSAT